MKQIGRLLDRTGFELADGLRMQRTVLEQKRRLLDRAIQAIRAAEHSIEPGRRAESALLTKIIEVIEMQNDNSWSEKYYSPEAREKIAARAKEWTPELQAEVSKKWMDLFAEVEALLAEDAAADPAGEKAQALGARWKELVKGFTGGDAQVGAGLNKLYADRPNWPAQAKEQMAPFGSPRVWEFMGRVMKCGL